MVEHTSYEAPRYAVFSILLELPHSYAQLLSTISQTPPNHALPSLKFQAGYGKTKDSELNGSKQSPSSICS